MIFHLPLPTALYQVSCLTRRFISGYLTLCHSERLWPQSRPGIAYMGKLASFLLSLLVTRLHLGILLLDLDGASWFPVSCARMSG